MFQNMNRTTSNISRMDSMELQRQGSKFAPGHSRTASGASGIFRRTGTVRGTSFKRSTIKQHRRTPSVLTDGVENVATFTVNKFPKMLRKVLDLLMWSCVSGPNTKRQNELYRALLKGFGQVW